MKKKRKGSSFIIVIIIMAILFTTGTAILTLAGSDYKMRTNSSKKLENMYAADSGLDVVYNVILKNSEAAIICANQIIAQNYNGKEMTNELYEKINAEFKEEFIKFLGTVSLGKGKNTTDAILSQGIINSKYMILKEDGSFDWKSDIDKKSEIEIIEYIYDETKKTIKIKVESTFETVDKEIKNKKIIETEYEVSTPDYKEPISSDSVLIDIYPVFDGKVITADGNLVLNGPMKVTGDMWVKGNSELKENPSYVFDKYNGGIVIENGELDIAGNIFTNRTLHLKNLAKANIMGDVYALNAYVGKSDKISNSGGNELILKDNGEIKNNIEGNLIVNNDLALNATKSNVAMNNFYGINEKTETLEKPIENMDKAIKSSSIIVNDDSATSKLEVIDSAYIMGVAYIDTLEDKYQTGESVAVKGNYSVYSEVLPGYEDKVTLKYYNPLHLIETIENKSKAEYFTKYYEQNKASIANGGIKLGNVYSTGAYVRKSDDENSSEVGNNGINDDSKKVVETKRNDFVRNVYSMGNTNGLDKTNEIIYKDGKVLKTVSNQINFEKIIDKYQGELILNKGKDKTIVIKGSGDNRTYSEDKYIVIDASENIKAVIITNGNVLVTGKVDFIGNIITEGNVTFDGINNNEIDGKKLTYDTDVTRRIIAANYDLLSEALKHASTIEQKVEISIGDNVNVDISSDGYNLKGLVGNSNWKIVK